MSDKTVSHQNFPVAIVATQAPPRTKPSILPEPFASRMAGRVKHPLGDLFGLANFGVNLVRLLPGAGSALRHAHSRQDEFVYILQGQPVLITDTVVYPDDDLQAALVEGKWQFARKDGTPY